MCLVNVMLAPVTRVDRVKTWGKYTVTDVLIEYYSSRLHVDFLATAKKGMIIVIKKCHFLGVFRIFLS